VFTALDLEYQAVHAHLDGGVLARREERGTLYEIGSFSGVTGPWTVVLAQTGPGNTTAGIQLDRAVPVFAPDVALFVGVAGGRKDVALGDVVAADAIYDYETGRVSEREFFARIKTHHPAFRLVQWAQLVARGDGWRDRVRPVRPDPPPVAFVKPLAAGSSVVAHERSRIARLLDRHCGDALAVEMEGHGFLQGAYVNAALPALVVRGISDLLSGKDAAGDRVWQPLAARNAAAFAFELLSCLPHTAG
jgi:nucleoside phosphorylase